MLKLAVFDFEGVFTDGTVCFANGPKQNITNFYRREDINAVSKLHGFGVKLAALSALDDACIYDELRSGLKFDFVRTGVANKEESILSLVSQLGFKINEVAYLSSDLCDSVKEIGLSACPRDAPHAIHPAFKYVSSRDGGHGCVEEFCEIFVKSILRHSGAISCVIPCSNSAASAGRVKNVNTRKFANTSLLEMKLDTLSQLCFKEIVLSTDEFSSVEKYADNQSVVIHRRHPELCKPDLQHDKLYDAYIDTITTGDMFHTTPISPFVSAKSIAGLLNFWKTNAQYDLIVFSKKVENILTNTVTHVPLQQVGFIVDGKAFKETGRISDIKKRKLIDLDEMEQLCIKTNFDFAVAESLVYRSLNQAELIDNYMMNSRFDCTKILDCTIRDAGYMNNWNWSFDTVQKFTYWMGEIGVTYCEIGFLKDKEFVEEGAGVWRNLTEHMDMIAELKSGTKSKIAVMVDIGSHKEEKYIDSNLIPPSSETAIDLIRVFCYIEILDEGISYCNELKSKGYLVSLNIGYAAHLNLPGDVNSIKHKIKADSCGLDYLYFADSLGMLTPNDLNAFMCDLKDIYPVKNGFHNHDNQGTVFGNLITLINCNIDIVDATISGFGKNGGNANLEQLIMYLAIKEGYDLKIESLLFFLEKIRDVDFGEANIFDVSRIKTMLQQFMDVHSSHADFSVDLVSLYRQLKSTPYKKKLR